jgi:hypothetical protein
MPLAIRGIIGARTFSFAVFVNKSVHEFSKGLLQCFVNDRIPISALLCLCLLGIDELGLQLEEPFSVLPQHAITENSIGKVLTESVGWRKTDYDRMLEAYYNGQKQ